MNCTRISTNIGAFLLLFTFIAIVLITPSILAETNVQEIYHNPGDTITSDDEVTIFITLKNTDNLSSIQYQYCELDPLGTCSIYKDMTLVGGNRYSGVVPTQDGGITVGYKVKIEYNDDSEEYSPDEENYHDYYVEEDKEDDDSPFPTAPLLVLSMLFATVIVYKRKNVQL